MKDNNNGSGITEFVFDLPEKKKSKINGPVLISVILAVLLVISFVFNVYYAFFHNDQVNYYVAEFKDDKPNVDTNTFPLLASDEDNKIYLYGTPPYGFVLLDNGVASQFDWINIYDGMNMPELNCYDIDRDGKTEIVVIEKNTDEKGESQHGVHVIKFKAHGEDKPIYYDAGMTAMDLVSEFKETIGVTHDSEINKITISVDGKSYDIDHKNNNSERNYLAGAIGRVVEFKTEGSKISAFVSVDVVYDNGEYEQIGTIETQISYNPEKLDINNAAFVKIQ